MSRCLWLLLIGLACGLTGRLSAAVEDEPILVPPMVAPDLEEGETAATTAGGRVSTARGEAELTAPSAETAATEGPVSVSVRLGDEELAGYSTPIKLLLLITILSVAPGVLMLMTSFTRIIIVLGFLRRALGTQTLPPNQVVLGLALILTFFVMAPTLQELNDQSLQPYLSESISEQEALQRATTTIREFMARHTRKDDLSLFIKIAGEERPETIDDVSFFTLVPAFVTSELKTAFQMGFVVFLPFVIIDLVIAAVLMALGMMMLPPVMVSLPFKILLFVLVDGWTLLIQSIVASYG